MFVHILKENANNLFNINLNHDIQIDSPLRSLHSVTLKSQELENVRELPTRSVPHTGE